MADSKNNKNVKSSNFLPNFYKTDPNKKFLQATIDQLIQPGTVKKINGYIGRQNAKSTKVSDIFISEATKDRENYQLEPSLVVKDDLGNTTYFKDYSDYINQLDVFGGNVKNHSRINSQDFYSWDPHIDWDKFVNFQNYYWLPYGPEIINIAGQQRDIETTYDVIIERDPDSHAYLFSPKGSLGLVRNPTIKLYRGITYKFQFENVQDVFLIKTIRSGDNLNEYFDENLVTRTLENGNVEIEFLVNHNTPGILYYLSSTDIDVGGTFEILSITENTFLNVDQEILGKKTYILPNGTALSNGMKVRFVGNVEPENYSIGQYYVEGVGDSITLVDERILEVVSAYSDSQSILFDNTPFDSLPFSDATEFAGTPDYIVINRSSIDRNQWSRYNRWFHKDVIEESAVYNGQIPNLSQTSRAVRPIIEFEANLKLFNFGIRATIDIDLIDDYTTDVFSNIEGQLGYNIDGIQLAQNQKILFVADNDILVKNKIFQVEFLTLNGTRQIHLNLIATPSDMDVALIRNGKKNQGKMYWFDGSTWVQGQQKTELNQAPLFDLINSNKESLSDLDVYDGSTFAGTKIFSYKLGSGNVDSNLGFALSYKNIENIGDIVFNFNLETDTFQYKDVVNLKTLKVNTAYLIKTINNKSIYVNGWQTAAVTNIQPGVRIYNDSKMINASSIVKGNTYTIADLGDTEFTDIGAVNNYIGTTFVATKNGSGTGKVINKTYELDLFDDINNLSDLVLRVYINGIRIDQYTSKTGPANWLIENGVGYKKINFNYNISGDDVITFKAFSAQPINDNGHYEIPINLQNNPLNDSIQELTLGEVIDHVTSIAENLSGFIGFTPGSNNIRDLGNVTKYGTKFVQHTGPLGLSMYHITSETNNIIKALEKSRDDYNRFKRNFLTVAETIGIDADPITLVDLILQKINKDKPDTFPYYFSDMVPYGANVRNEYQIFDYRIKTYPLTEIFNLDELSNKAVLVYYIDRTLDTTTQLLYGRDYSFDNQGFVVISAEIKNDDTIVIYEYDSTHGSFVPATPTKLGLWPKYQPMIYTDTTLLTPRVMIQGHDGSQILAYNDYRDDLVLELEKRIFNNIKVSYDQSIFDINDIIPQYHRSSPYSLKEFNETLAPSFYKWTSLIDRDFSKPLSYDRQNPKTFNYRGQGAPDGREVPGYWKGIYLWILGTDRPNLCPWEMLGIYEKPTWWEDLYGPAPYTSDNLILWNDLANGIIRGAGSIPTISEKYKRPYLIDHIPVDGNGNIISPIESGLAIGIITQSTSGDFVFGDVSPIESAWRRSSFYPYSVILTSMLLYPAKTFGLLLDRSRIVKNLAGQLIYKDTGVRVNARDIVLPSIYSSSSTVYTSGIINYLVDYILSDNLKSYNVYRYDLKNLTTNMSYRIGGFTSKEKFKLLLDSKTPLSSGSVFIPPEDYDIILNLSSAIKKITYSAVIVTKLEDGYELKGYSRTQPYFKYYPWYNSGYNVNVGGISNSYFIWTPGEKYRTGNIVKYNNSFYRVTTPHIAKEELDLQYCELLPSLPYVGGSDAIFRTKWDRDEEIVFPYGTKLKTVQEVVDFLLGYGEWLKDQGFVFDEFNKSLNAVTNWETSAKEFMFWTTQNWSTGQDKWQDWLPNNSYKYMEIVKYNGDYYKAIRTTEPSPIFNDDEFVKLDGLSTIGSSVLALSPAANGIVFSTPLSVVDDIRNSFNGYEIFTVDGLPLAPSFINSYRDDNLVTYIPKENNGIYCATFYLKQQEQVVVLNNNTMFNDTIYNPVSGYRQEKIKVAGYKTTSWNGSFNAPGFIFDRAIIQEWDLWKDYNLGDIVKYKEFYYSAKTFLPGVATFNPIDWIKLDEKPSSRLIPNWSYKASQFEDFYSLDSDNFDIDQQTVAQHLVGYQKRQYLSNIIKDDVSEFKFYQGMITEKGTHNSLNKLFDVLSADNQESIDFYEEWAVRTGNYGAINAFNTIEFVLDESLFRTNPQNLELSENVPQSNIADLVIRQGVNDVYLKPLGYNSNPWPIRTSNSTYLRTPGFVRTSDVQFIFRKLEDLLCLNEWNLDVLYNFKDTVNYDGKRYVSLTTNRGSVPSIAPSDWEEFSIQQFKNRDYVWCGFENTSWEVYRFTPRDVSIIDITFVGTTATIQLDRLVSYNEGDIIGIYGSEIEGFYKIDAVSLDTFDITLQATTLPSSISITSIIIIGLDQQKLDTIDDLNETIETFEENDLIWTVDSGDGKWATWKRNSVYSANEVLNPSPQEIEIDSVSTIVTYGRKLALNHRSDVLAVSNSLGEIVILNKLSPNTPWIQKQTVVPPFISKKVGFVYPTEDSETGDVIGLSNNDLWLVTGTPTASNVCTNYVGQWNIAVAYLTNNIVKLNGVYYRAKIDVPAGNNPETNKTYWKKLYYLPIEESGTNSAFTQQGVITIYKRDANKLYTVVDTIASPNLASNEKFGTNVSIKDNELFVSAIGHSTNKGIVYRYSYIDRVEASAYYNPVNSIGSTITVSSTDNIEVGMKLKGTGFDTTHLVVQIIDSTTLLLNQAPSDTPSGLIDFYYTLWGFTQAIEFPLTPTTNDSFGYAIDLSNDLSTFVVSSINNNNVGKVFVYNKVNDIFVLSQTIATSTNDRFGNSLSLSDDGMYLAASSTEYDGLSLKQGLVSIYSKKTGSYVKEQDIVDTNPKERLPEFFGSKVFFMNDSKTLVIYSSKADVYVPTTYDTYSVTFDEFEFIDETHVPATYQTSTYVKDPSSPKIDSPTTFDNELTRFTKSSKYDSGRIDVYDRYATKWVFSESINQNLDEIDNFGEGIAVGVNCILASAPNASDKNIRSGKVFEYAKRNNDYTWKKVHYQESSVDVTKIKRAFLYNKSTNQLVKYLDVLDPAQGKIPGIADQEIKFKTFYDPAIYSKGTSEVTVDEGISWNKSKVGQLWWDLRTAKFIDSYSNDSIYKNSNWNRLFPGASIDIYEWVETTLLPSEWDDLADTDAGITDSISGQSLYGDLVYSSIKTYDKISRSYTTTYYYWVKNKKTVPSIRSRSLSAEDIANLIENPRGEGYSYIGFTGSNSLSISNVKSLLSNKDIILSVDYWTVENIKQNIHSEWKVISTDIRTTIPKKIEEKWYDSLCGKDHNGREVPDMTLPLKIRYGIENRPRQGMFINRFEVLKQIIEETNRVLLKHQIAKDRDLSKLETYDVIPSPVQGFYDIVLDTDSELRFAGAGAFFEPTLTPVIINGKIVSVTITDAGSGFGRISPVDYDVNGNAILWDGPLALINGSGVDAEIKTFVNSRGQISSVEIVSSGYGYLDVPNTTITVRSFSALVTNDSQNAGGWSIYAYDLTTKLWSRVKAQAYDTRTYWEYVDWFEEGYNQFVSFDHAIDTFSELASLETYIGDIVKIRRTGDNKWVLLEKYNISESSDWTQSYRTVGLQEGTIQFKSSIYQYIDSIYGYDGSLYDTQGFDNYATIEIRYILEALRDNIFIDNLKEHYLNLFFTSIRYLLSEQLYVDWVFKTSFVKARHNVGELKEKVTYNNDNLSDFEAYVAEVKPYRTQIREYVSSYNKVDNSYTAFTDFDLPSVYENGKLEPVNVEVIDGEIISNTNQILTYPWKFWYDNAGFKVTEIKIVDGGSGYLSAPTLTFNSLSGSGAVAKAYITQGKVNRVILISSGEGYLSAPTIEVNGSLEDGGTPAKIVAIIGDSVVRSNHLKMKFDRITNSYYITSLQQTEMFTGTGSRLQYPLIWAPDVRIGKSTVLVNGVEELRENYRLLIVKSTTRGYTSYSGSIIFETPPTSGSSISVTYLKDWSTLNAADRIQYYYNPTEGQLGKDLSQLMTGVDYGGVVINGMGFDVGFGWDSVPYYSGKWDSYDGSFDDYIETVSADKHIFTLPYIPDQGVEINVYYSTLKTFITDITIENSSTTVFSYDPVVVYPPKVSVTKTAITNVINYKGFTQFTVVDSTGIKLDDVISTDPILVDGDLKDPFGFGTKVIDIIGNVLILSQIFYIDIPSGRTITFTRELIDPTDCTINQNGTVFLVDELAVGSKLIITSPLNPIRIDDPNYGGPDPIENDNAIMETFYGDNLTDTIEIPSELVVSAGDKFIFRKSTSDGAIKPQDFDYDTALSGGDLAYNSAIGIAADDIIVDGDGFVTPNTSPATEEVVPGQVVDAVAIKVFDRPKNGSANIKVDNYIGDGITTEFVITQQINSNRAVIVKTETGTSNKLTDIRINTFEDEYTIDYVESKIVFDTAPAENAVISITSFGFNGLNILDINYVVADGFTSEFVTAARWSNNVVSLIYLNGVQVTGTEVELFQTSDPSPNRIGIRFLTTPAENSLINYLIVDGSVQTFSVMNTQRILVNGSDEYTLDYIAGTNKPIESNMIVRVNDKILKSPMNCYYTIKNNRLTYKLDTIKFAPYSVPANEIIVIADQNILVQNVDYILDLKGISIKLVKSVYTEYAGKTLIISIITGAEYEYIVDSPARIKFNNLYNNDEVVEVITAYNHDILDAQRTKVKYVEQTSLTPDTLEYFNYLKVSTGVIQLDRSVIDDSFVWVIKNGSLLTPSVDFKLNPNKSSITLSKEPNDNDEYSILTFGSNVLTSGIAYMQFKDMLNRYHFKRLSKNKQTTLVKDLRYNDLVIKVEDATSFDLPNPTKNKPGVVEIRGERIEYFSIIQEEFTDDDGTREISVLGRLRRGTLGTGASKIHRKGAKVQCIGPSETLPYTEVDAIEKSLCDGNSNVVNLSFVPARATLPAAGMSKLPRTEELVEWVYQDSTFESTIPEGYGQTDEIEVFVGGIRLKKKPHMLYDNSLHPESPEGDVQFDAEFSVDGVSNELRLTKQYEFGTQIVVIKRTGTDWDSFNNIQYSDTKIAQFLKATPGIWYTAIDKYESKSDETVSTFDSNVGTFDSTDITFDQG